MKQETVNFFETKKILEMEKRFFVQTKFDESYSNFEITKNNFFPTDQEQRMIASAVYNFI